MNLSDPSLLRTDGYVDGAWMAGQAGRRFTVADPATGKTLANIADLDAQDTVRAIEAAGAALPAWRDKTGKERAAILREWSRLILANQEDLAQLMTAEQGKPLAEARGEVASGAGFAEWFAEEAKRTYGDVIPTPAQGKRILVVKQPVGVVGAISPWNFPHAMIMRKCAPALAAGCTVVIKPSEHTPLSALALGDLAHRAGIPKGVFNVVPSTLAQEVGLMLTQHPLVRKFSFTGSTAVGRRLMAQCASTVKRVSLELGGNAPFIVFDDADLDAAADGALISKYRNMGQTCVCANRFLVQASIADAFEAKLIAKVEALKVGGGTEAGVTQGPLINGAAVEKVERLIAEAVADGAEIKIGGHRHALGGGFFEPTLLTGVTPAMSVSREEIFGPVATIVRFETEADALRMANDTEYGLAAYFYARDLGRVLRVAEALEYGMVAVNDGLLATEVAPFGGIKQSGLGREGSKYGIEDYLEIKYLALAGLA
ncbi:MAG: NAD-dependent succinate-semialdehyde dehydrogenase [Phenylobacterium sp.]|nr:MAG: NAD-dependent succinate-semialdehyde dehydrogenase [Phenylobacterium sp.]